MYYNIIRPILIGLIVGAACFFMPFFILKVVLFFFIAGVLLRMYVYRKMRRFFGTWVNPRFVEKIRNMNEDEFTRFKQRNSSRSYDYYNRPQGPVINVEIK
jgi:hypothetical protein